MTEVLEAIEEMKTYRQWVAWSRSKVPVSPRGRPASSTDPATWGSLEEAKFIRSVQGLPGVGFVISQDDPYVGIDLDDAIDPSNDELRPWAQEIVERINSYTELSPSGLGVHIWVRGKIPRNGARTREGAKVEAYQSNRYFTVTGKHLKGTPTAIMERNLSIWFEETFGQAAPRTMSGEWEAPSIHTWIDSALSHISADDYHDWVKVGMALKAELGDQGFYIWDSWSSRSSKYGGSRATARKWESFDHDGDVRIASVVWMAEQGGFEMPKPTLNLPASINKDWDQWLSAQSHVIDPNGLNNELEIILYDAADLYLDTTPPEPDLIEPGVLGAGDFALLFGPPKAMKSMVVMDMFRQFALGRPWCRFSPLRPLRTLYAQFEVKGDKMRQRLQLAPMSRRDIELLRGNLFITERFTPVLTAEFVAEFAEVALKTFGEQLDVLILDPLANIYSGDSENDNAQMARFIRQIKLMRNAISPKVAILLVHHAGKKDRTERAAEPFNAIRGASSLRGAYDAGIYLDREEEESENIKMWCELRNGPRQSPITLAFRDGRFHEVDAATPSAAEAERDDIDLERDVVERILRDEALLGRYYTPTTFSEAFAGHPIIGSAPTIRRHLSRLATIQAIGLFSRIPDVSIPELHHRAQGYLCCREMYLRYGERLVHVVPTHMRDICSGNYIEVDSTLSW